MRNSKPKNLSSIFMSAVEKASKTKSESSTSSSAQDLVTLKNLISLSSSGKISSGNPEKSSKKSPRVLSKEAKKSSSTNARKLATSALSSEKSDDPPIQFLKEMSSILCDSSVSESHNSPASQISNDRKLFENILNIPCYSNISPICISQRRKELSRERKQKWIFKNTQTLRFERLVRMCAEKLGTETTLEVFGKLGRETGIKEYNALIKLCIQNARESNDDEVSLDQIHKAFQLFNSMREQGFPLEEETYGPFLVYLIDMGMIQEFHFFSKFIKDENPGSFSKLGYYEMLLWIKVKNEDKVQELCNSVGLDSGGHSLTLAGGVLQDYLLTESYLLALCKNGMQKEILQLLEVVDITKLSSLECLTTIFKSLGRLLLEDCAEKFFLAFRIGGTREEDISFFIYNYSISIPNLVVEEVISKFKNLHEKLEVRPSSAAFDKLITYCCDSLKVHAALDVVDQMQQSGLAISIETLQPILHASEQSFELDLVRPIYSMMRQHDLKPKCETFKSMISLYVKMKDFEGAYNMLKDVEDMNMMPTSNMYNAIMAGYFREKNIAGGLMVLKKMELADVKPDSETFSYLISNCQCEGDIIKYYEELQNAGVQMTKHVYMALINAYAKCGQFEKAKQVLFDKRIPFKNKNEIKSALVAALASNGQILDALNIYEEVKEAGCHLEPKAIICLIEYIQSEGELNKLLQLLGELNESSNWFDGCSRIVLYCVRFKHLSSAVDLLKQLKEKDELVTYMVFDQMFSQISETEPTDLETGLDLLRAIKEELDLHPSRTSLDFLLSACASAKDPHRAQLIWEEYQEAGLSFNVLTYLRMYQALLASGERKSATKLLKKIPRDDPHVRFIIRSCEATYSELKS